MKVVLYMAMTLNGYIANRDDETPWSDAVWDSYYEIAKQFKAIILGRRTYEIMKEANEFEKIGNPFTVVVSERDFPLGSGFIIAKSPEQALSILREKNFLTALVGGGGILNSAFMKEKLIDEIIIDVEPLIFGKGIKLFSENDFQVKLELLGTKNISKNTVQVHYRVLK